MSAAPQLAENLFNEHHRRIYRYCLRRLGSPEEAEDAVQATFLNAYRSLNDGFEPEAAQAWLFKVAHNVCLTRQRSSYRRARVERPEDLQAVQDVVAAPETSGDELFGLDEALADLPEQQRRAILLREWQGLSYREVAAKLGLTQAAVETLIFRARRSLASALEQPAKHRRSLRRSLDAGALVASLKSVFAGNVAAAVASGVAVAASATALTVATVNRGSDFPPHAVPAPQVDKKTPPRAGLADAPRAGLADRSLTPTVSIAPGAAPKGKHWAGTHPRGKDKPRNPNRANHGDPSKPAHANGGNAPASLPSQAQSERNAESPAARAYGRGGKKG
jgi:RNA polymerase sigma factor (sigma-70 family)